VFIFLRDVISAATPEYWEFWIGALLIVLVMVGRERIRDLALRAAALYPPRPAR
jgi:branched-chain amino acid transport system permease protein